MLRASKVKKKGLQLLMAAVMSLTVFPGAVPLYAHDTAEDPDGYIVKYREDCISLMDDEGAPFEVVEKKELQRLLQEDALEWYEKDGDAVLMEQDPSAALMDTGSVYYDSEQQWNLGMIHADEAFRNGNLGQGIRVGVIDSGVSPHQDFGSRLLQGHNYMAEAEGNTKKVSDTADEYGHGTRVAGLIAASGESGYIGAAPEAELVPLKCTDGKNVKVSTICRAIYGGIDDYDCDVLNLSLGVATEYESLKEAIEYAAEKNIVVVSAVGNGGSTTQYYPARYDTVIGVGSVDSSGNLYSRSNHHSSVFLTAPGVNVRSTDCHGGYSESTGCSFAVPQVSAAAAVMLGIDRTLTVDGIMRGLSETATDRGAEGYDEYFGYGIMNLGKCVAELTDNREPDPVEPAEDPVQPSPAEDPVQPDPSEDPGKTDDPSDSPDDGKSSDPSDTDPDDPVQPTQPSSPSGPAAPSDPSTPVTPVVPADPGEDPVQPAPSGQDSQTEPDDRKEPQAPEPWTQCTGDQNCILKGYSDLDPSAWYHDGVHYVLLKGIMKGYDQTTFRPDQETTRAMIVTMLWRMEGSPQVDDDVTFKDVPDGQWYTDAVRWAAKNGIVTGYSEDTFGPADDVSREQFVTILYRYAQFKGVDVSEGETAYLNDYTDARVISDWAVKAFRWAVKAGVIQGMTETTLSPKSDAVRAQVATMLMRLNT